MHSDVSYMFNWEKGERDVKFLFQYGEFVELSPMFNCLSNFADDKKLVDQCLHFIQFVL